MSNEPEQIELEQEVHHLRDKCRRFGALAKEMGEQLQILAEPKPRPRPEVLVALTYLATLAGLPARCGDRACRRAGTCCAVDIGTHACADLWSNALFDELELMAAGVALSALVDEQLDATLHDQFTQRTESPAPKDARSRKPRSK